MPPTRDEGPARTKTAKAQAAQADAALQRQKAAAEAEKKRQQKEAAAAGAAAKQAGGANRYLAGLPDVFIMNKDGEKYQTVRFTHAAHSSEGFVPGVTCQTCHHTLKGDKKPEKCFSCHQVGGEADETEKKSQAVHSREHPFPKEPGQEAVSCHGCHRAENVLLESGGRSGKEAPVKCTGCHQKKEG